MNQKKNASTKLWPALGSGLAGGIALTLAHETLRRIRPADAPCLDLLGLRALRKILAKTEAPQPDHRTAYGLTMAGDIISNGLYYSLVGHGPGVWKRALGLGVAAGVGAVQLPKPLGLGSAPSSRTPQTKAMTIGLYVLGALVAAGTAQLTARKES